MRELLLEGTWNVWIRIDEVENKIIQNIVDIYEIFINKRRKMEEIFQTGTFSSEQTHNK